MHCQNDTYVVKFIFSSDFSRFSRTITESAEITSKNCATLLWYYKNFINLKSFSIFQLGTRKSLTNIYLWIRWTWVETLWKAHTIQMNFKFQEKYKMSRTTTKYQSSAWMLSMFLFPLNSWEKFQYAKSCKFSIDLLLE